MAKAVAKRSLKKSYYEKIDKTSNKKEFKILNILNKPTQIKDIHMDTFDTEQINGLYKRNGANRPYSNKKETNNEDSYFAKFKKRFVVKTIIQSITMVALFIFCISVKYMKLKIVVNSEICKKVVKEFKTNYSKEQIIEYVSNIWDKAYTYIDPIIPDELSKKTVTVFSNVLKKFENKSKDNNVNVYNESNIKIYEESNTNIDDSKDNNLEPEKEYTSANTSTQIEDKNIVAIKESNVEFVKPTSGVITSRFGERDPIFQGVDSYHYGTDIANVEGTDICSSIDGTVTVCATNNETGNYIEVQSGSITTRYCHLSKQLVKVGDKVNNGTLIGKMGKTGMATGSHLHFEIMYNRTRVDAEKILSLE